MILRQAGGAVVLELVDESAQLVRYRIELEHAGTRHATVAHVALADGAVSFDDFSPPDPPPWLLEYARQFLRSAWRKRAEAPWPRRISRWRDAK
jgi:hypothetical protein